MKCLGAAYKNAYQIM